MQHIPGCVLRTLSWQRSHISVNYAYQEDAFKAEEEFYYIFTQINITLTGIMNIICFSSDSTNDK